MTAAEAGRAVAASVVALCGATFAAAEQYLVLAPGDRPATIAVSGVVTSEDVLRFSAPPSRNWSLVITELAQEGRRVSAGDLLARFDSSQVDDRLRDLDGDLAEARRSLASLTETQDRAIEEEKVALAAAESRARKAERKAGQPAELIASLEYRKLVEEKRIAIRLLALARERLPKSAQFRAARRAELRARIRQLEIRHAAATREIKAFSIHAPRAGLVVLGTDHAGDKLEVGGQVYPGVVVVELANDAALAARAEVPEHLAVRLAADQPARVTADSAGGAIIDGRIAKLANTVRRKSFFSPATVRDVDVRFDAPAGADLRLGMAVHITIEVAVTKDALAVPLGALVYDQGRPGVIRRGDGWVPVTLGDRSDAAVVVSAGLKVGDEVRL